MLSWILNRGGLTSKTVHERHLGEVFVPLVSQLSIFVFELPENHQQPNNRCVENADEHRQAGNIFGAFGEVVWVVGNAINGGFNRGVNQFDNQHQNDAADHHNFADAINW